MAEVVAEWIENPVTYLVVIGIGATVFYIGRWVGMVNHKTSDLAASLVGLKEVLVAIKDVLTETEKRLATNNSPRQLTKFGEKIANAMEAGEWARRLVASGKFAKVREPHEADYQARQFAYSDRSGETQKVLSVGVYQSGLDETSVRSVLAIVLREEIIRQLRKPAP